MLVPQQKTRAPSLAFVLLAAFLVVLWIAGGASRADALGQAVVRGGASALLAAAVLLGVRPSMGRARPVWILLASASLLAVLQLVPLPPDLWSALPGRAPLLEAAAASGQAQPWRPWSIVPGAAANAAFSLLVPLTALALATGLRPSEHASLPGALLVFVGASALLGLLQFSGSSLNNPLINELPGQVGGGFANRNHFALLMALGCLLAPAWAAMGPDRATWRRPVASGLALMFFLLILASGSRAGTALGLIALPFGLVMGRRAGRGRRGRPRRILIASVAGVAIAAAALVALSVAADRAVSIERLFAIDQDQDMRRRGWPVVLGMIGTYFPVGTGLGGFDAAFRMHEPFALLKRTYFNHAHNDFLEVALELGLAGVILLAAALGWWARAGVRAWRTPPGRRGLLPRLGWTMLLLVLVASVFDYPARTPIVMALLVIAAVWTSGVGEAPDGSPLPRRKRDL